MGANPTAAIVVGAVLVLGGMYLTTATSTGLHILGWFFVVIGAVSMVINLVLRSRMRR